MKRARVFGGWLVPLVVLAGVPAQAQESDEGTEASEEEGLTSGTFGALRFRSIGPALMSGRIGDIAVNPGNHSEWYVAVASGGVWKTVNNGTTFTPIFDSEGSYSIGCVTIDPNNLSTVWVGTGENNSQRSVSWGDGVYKSTDAGKSWTNMGLEDSQHIGMIRVDPRDSDVVYVASQGPLWNAGGDRGLYKTTDGGETWELILEISEHTGVNEIHLDPRDPDVMYASSYQRRRRVWTLINGGPESAIYKSVDGGESWEKLSSGLPSVDMGRIGLGISPANPDYIYAIIEAADDKQGVYRSTDRGSTWNKMNSWVSSSPQYYNELVCHPHDEDTVYFLETFLRITTDGGETIERVPITDKHVDDHALWIDPTDTRHMINGSDGGIYETWDAGANWDFKANLPITQFYKIGIDNSEPFYYVYGGTQDNNTQGGPTQTIDIAGIANEDWFITVGGDGFEVVIDPLDPNLVYCQWQYGGLTRFDRASGEQVDIRPIEAPGEDPYVFNWDAGLMLSPHLNTRLYFGADRLFRSDDRGDSWQVVSPDLTRRLDRNQLEVMGVIQKPDAVAKHVSTSIYGNIVSIAESPFVEGLLYVGSDDGQISISEDGGANWRAEIEFPGVPDMSYVAYLTASQHDSDTVFAAFDNHKSGDFTPYLLRSDDRGRTWTSIAGNLPEDDVVYAIQQDHVDPDLLFCGTEFGAYYTVDGGEHWVKFKGIPTIAIMDLELQRRENDVVVGSFGRGFYVLDDYTPLRNLDEDVLEQEAHIFPIPEAEAYIMTSRLGMNTGRGFQGASWYSAPNPPFGATMTYYVKDKPQTIAEVRKESEKEEEWEYPTIDEFRAEDTEQEPQFYMQIADSSGNVIRRIDLPRKEGVQRATWDLRYRSSSPISLRAPTAPMWAPPNAGPLVVPGVYSASLWLEDEGATRMLAGPSEFPVRALDLATITDEDKAGSLEFYLEAVELHQAVLGANRYRSSLNDRIEHVRRALIETRGADVSLLDDMEEIRRAMIEVRSIMSGDPTLGRRAEPSPTSISSRLSSIMSDVYVTSPPTQTHREQFGYAGEQFVGVLTTLRDVTDRLARIEAHLDEVKAPWTPGRLPKWDGPILP